MKLGIIGLPASGKTTVFETLTKNFSDGDNKSDNRVGTVKVPDSRVDILSEMYRPRKTIFAQVEYFLPGRLSGKKDQTTWTQVRDCDALIHVVRNFTGYGLESPTPAADVRFVNQEMVLADLIVVEKRLETLKLEKQRGKKFNSEEYALLEVCHETLEQEIPIRENAELAAAPLLRGFTFISAKPLLVLFNNGDEDANPPESDETTRKEEYIVLRGRLEHELAQMSEEEARDFLKEFEIENPAMDRVITKSYDLLGLISFFTVGEDEVRAWTISKGTAAVDAADVIHSDIKKGFIRAEVLYYDDLMAVGSYQNARKKGTVRLEGKTYPVINGDIINFRFNV
ncbi:MAG: DUF933 domain-containing protein [bacterium]